MGRKNPRTSAIETVQVPPLIAKVPKSESSPAGTGAPYGLCVASIRRKWLISIIGAHLRPKQIDEPQHTYRDQDDVCKKLAQF